ncbi:MAG: DUF4404 family protein [Desulfobacterales bacterium]|nr:DUF4404 family protein [Desulfobacterales bacterium]
MLKHTLEKIEAKIKQSPNIPEEKKTEYFDLLKQLNNEINELDKTDHEKAKSVKEFTKAAAHESTREEINPRLFQIALDGLSSSVREFEASHPRLVQTVNSISTFLSKIGI